MINFIQSPILKKSKTPKKKKNNKMNKLNKDKQKIPNTSNLKMWKEEAKNNTDILKKNNHKFRLIC